MFNFSTNTHCFLQYWTNTTLKQYCANTASYQIAPTLLSSNTASYNNAPTPRPTPRPTTLHRQHYLRTTLHQNCFLYYCAVTTFEQILRQHCFPTTLHQHCLLQYCANTAPYNITLRQYCANTASYNNAPALHYTSGCDKTRTQRRILECPARQTKQRLITQGHENQALITNTRQNEKITKLMFRALSPSSSL